MPPMQESQRWELVAMSGDILLVVLPCIFFGMIACFAHFAFWRKALASEEGKARYAVAKLTHLLGTFVLTVSHWLLAGWAYVVSDVSLTQPKRILLQAVIALGAISVGYLLLWVVPQKLLKGH